MATWIAHLRIADYFLDKIPAEHVKDFIVGNIGPDSGVPNMDWTVFTPSTDISHWRKIPLPGRDEKEIDFESFYSKYLNDNRIVKWFYIGYYIHLLSDYYWGQLIYLPKYEKILDDMKENKVFIWRIKKDWYDLDFEYINNYKDKLNSFTLFNTILEYDNKYLDYFPEHAFTQKVKYIQEFYKEKRDLKNKKYEYLNREDMDYYISEACKSIEIILTSKNLTIAST